MKALAKFQNSWRDVSNRFSNADLPMNAREACSVLYGGSREGYENLAIGIPDCCAAGVNGRFCSSAAGRESPTSRISQYPYASVLFFPEGAVSGGPARAWLFEGQHIIINSRIGEDGQFRELAAELVRLKMDVIVAQPPAIRAAMSATTTIPIVTISPGDPVLSGFVASLERPGRNVTGVGGLTAELGGKWLELIKETIPSAKQVAVFWTRRAEETFPLWRSVEAQPLVLSE